MKNTDRQARRAAGESDKGGRNMHWLGRYLLLGLAVVSLAIALLGIFLPGLPSLEFLLLAAWAAARSSPRLHNWMLAHRRLGPLLLQWQQGSLPRNAKWAASASMSLAALVLILSVDHLPSLAFCLLSMAAVLVWLWRKPEPLTSSATESSTARP